MGDLEIDEIGTMREKVYGEAFVVGIRRNSEFSKVWEDERVEKLPGDGSARGEDVELLESDGRLDDHPESMEVWSGPAVPYLNNLDHPGVAGGFCDAVDPKWEDI